CAAVSGAVGCSVAVVSSVTWPSLELDLDVDARRQVEPHERVDRLLGRVVDVDEPLVRTDLELLARVLVDERAADDGELLDTRGQRHRTRHRRARALRRLDDLRRGLVDELVVVRLQADPDALLCHDYRTSAVLMRAPSSRRRRRRCGRLRGWRSAGPLRGRWACPGSPRG